MAGPPRANRKSSIRFIGCCGAYCKTCGALREGACKGCKLGYDQGDRDLSRARCAMKLCCFREKRLETCADCREYPGCEIIHGFHAKKGFKYRKYRQSMEFIRRNGYPAFVRLADAWKSPYGRLE